MILQLTKNSDKPHVIKYIRDNGTETWMYSDDFFVLHDLSHYAIEKTLKYTTAFYGLLNNGMAIEDFEDREKRNALLISDEACYAENMANLFLMEITQGGFEDFNAVSGEAFIAINQKFSPPVLKDAEIKNIRIYLKQLILQWKDLPVGSSLQLTFEN
jgi:hypothetical protein